jgi:O-antigen/teichoic acid export membrane protein
MTTGDLPDGRRRGMAHPLIASLKARIADKDLSELLRGGSVAFSFKVLGIGAAYAFTLLVTRFYGAEVMGIFALCLTLLQVTAVVGRLGLDTALLRFVAEYNSQGKRDLVRQAYGKALSLLIPFGAVLSALLFLLSPYIAAHVFHKEHLAPYFRIISLAVLPFVLLLIHAESLRGLKKIREYAFFVNAALYVFAFALLGGALFLTRSSYAPVGAYLAATLLAASLCVLIWLRQSGPTGQGESGESKEDALTLGSMLGVSLPMLLASSLMFVMQWTDTVMLGMFSTEKAVGVYNVALRVSMLTSVTLMAINSIAAPKFAEFYARGDMEGLGRVARQSTRLIFWGSLPILLVFFVLPSFILGIFGPEFKAGVYALLLLAVGQFVNSISGSVGYILQMTGKQKVFQNIILVAAVLNIVLNAILIPRYGINGAAFASMVSMGVWNVTALIYIQRQYRIRIVYLPFAKRYGF